MATKIRLQRGGRKHYAFYSIVIADSRAPRDGKFIEKLGTYNPNANPSAVDLNFDRAMYWVGVGAQPTDTVRNILSREGVYLMTHLLGGVKKGAFDEAEAQKRFDAWKQDKQNGLNAVRESEIKAAKDKAAKTLEEEKKANVAKAKQIADKHAAELATTAGETSEEVTETAGAEAASAVEVTDAQPEANVETPVEEPKAQPEPEEVPDTTAESTVEESKAE